eukprot:XP_014621938.1 yippee family putative zinc-binding protein isoform X1 [Glycine max]
MAEIVGPRLYCCCNCRNQVSLHDDIIAKTFQNTIQDLLVPQGLDQALEDERPASINETEWTKSQRRAVNTIRLALSPEIKHNVLKETTPKALWEKLENIYVSKSLTNRLCLKMELYQFKMEMRGDLHDHINKFNQLVSQLLNADDKLFDESRRCYCWSHYQGHSKLWFKRCLWEDQL